MVKAPAVKRSVAGMAPVRHRSAGSPACSRRLATISTTSVGVVSLPNTGCDRAAQPAAALRTSRPTDSDSSKV